MKRGPRNLDTPNGAMTGCCHTLVGHVCPTLDPEQHGLDGPVLLVSTSSAGRDYPLRSLLHEAWASAGMGDIPNHNAGSHLGVRIAIECRSDQERIIAADAHSRKRIPFRQTPSSAE